MPMPSAADLLQVTKDLAAVLELHGDTSFAQFHGGTYERCREALVTDSRTRALVPTFLRTCRSATAVLSYFREHVPFRQVDEFVRTEFDPLFTYLERQSVATQEPAHFSDDPEAFMSRVVQLLMLRGCTREVAIVAFGKISVNGYHDTYGTKYYIRIGLPAAAYAQLDDKVKEEAADVIAYTAREIPVHGRDGVEGVSIDVDVAPLEAWREHALRWLRGEGINNQGRVRSDNLPSRQVDGLLFRSQPEIFVYQELKARGVAFAPLPVFLRGGTTYQRIEPDFVVIANNAVMIVEVDGDTIHRETPAEADARTRMFKHEGALIERVPASECDTPEKAKACVAKLLAGFDKWRSAR